MRPLSTDERVGVAAALIVFLWAATRFLVPVSHWYDVHTFEVRDAGRWQDVTVNLSRSIYRDFRGEWQVSILRHEGEKWVSYAASDPQVQDYSADASLPDPVTLEWFVWTEPRAYMLPCGNYRIIARWTVNYGSWLWERTVRRTSDFTIFGEGRTCTR